MDKKSKIKLFMNFDLLFGISVVLPLNFTDVFASNYITTYFKVILINISMKKLFSDDK